MRPPHAFSIIEIVLYKLNYLKANHPQALLILYINNFDLIFTFHYNYSVYGQTAQITEAGSRIFFIFRERLEYNKKMHLYTYFWPSAILKAHGAETFEQLLRV